MSFRLLDEARQDFNYGFRKLRRSPGYSVIAILALSLGIGTTTAVFSIVNGVLLKSFPYKNAEQLVLIFEHFPIPSALAKFGVSPPDYELLREIGESYSGMAAFQTVSYEVSGIGESRRVTSARVSSELFSVLGVSPILGRALTTEDDFQNVKVAVVTYGFWARVLGRNPSSLGRTILLDGQSYTLVGVMPEQFEFPPRGAEINGEPAEVLVPMSFSQFELSGFGMRYNNTVVARLKPEVTIAQARAEAGRLAKRLLEQYPPMLQNAASKLSIPVVPFNDEIVGRSRQMLAVLLGAVGMVLIIVCADVAALNLTQCGARFHEMAIRAALGSSWKRMLRQLLTESFVVALLGSLFGLLLAYIAMGALLSLAGQTLPRTESIAFDFRVVAFALALAIVTPLLFGSVPAMRTALGTDAANLKDTGRSTTLRPTRFRLLKGLVVAQFAIAIILSVGAGLLVRSFLRLSETDPGFRSQQGFAASVTLPSGRYAEGPQIRSFYNRTIAAARSIPGVLAAGAGNALPLNVLERRAFTADGAAVDPNSELTRMLAPTSISAGYLEALGVPLKRGRLFTDADSATSQPVVVINELLARVLWPNQDPIGERIKWGGAASPSPWLTVVGVVGDVKQNTIETPTIAQAYLPLSQERDAALASTIGSPFRNVNVVVRSARDAASLNNDLRSLLKDLDPALPVAQVEPLTEMLAGSLRPQRFSMTVVTLFAGVALILAAIGIYGVLSNIVAQQRHEIGIRMALGENAGHIRWLIIRRILALTAIGITIGLAGALSMTWLMAGLLYEVRPTDAVAFVGAVLVLSLLALAASLAPAWHATRVDPIVALRAK